MGTKTSTPQGSDPARTGNLEDGMVVLSYILAGLIFYGGLGWLGDHFLHTRWLLPLGLIVGLGLGIYLIVKRYGGPA